MRRMCFSKSLILSLALLFLAVPSWSLTFKSDGSVVQSDGTVVRQTAAHRFVERFSKKINWPVSTSLSTSDSSIKGYFGNGYLLPGTPLLSLHGIRMGDNYVEKLAEVNGFNSKSSLMRFMLSSATPSFITKELNITEDQAAKFVAQVSSDDIAYVESTERFSSDEKMLLSLLREIDQLEVELDLNELDQVVSGSIESELESQLENSVEDSVSETIEDAVAETIEDSVGQFLEESIESAMEASFNRAIQNIIDSGGTILETEYSEAGWSITHEGGSAE